MENGFKVRITRMFQSSFNSCRTKHTSDVAEQQFFFPENRHHRQLIDLFSPKPQPFRKPKKHVETHTKNNLSDSEPKISGKNIPLKAAGKPYSVSLPPPLFYEKKSKTAKKKNTHYRKTNKSQDFSSVTDNLYYDCCSSDEGESDGETTLFSSRSLSSDSSLSFRKNRDRRLGQKKPKKVKNRGGCKDRKATDIIPVKSKSKFIRDSVAVVKKSSDPHEDFRVSMLEMIVERQIFGAKDLENLLECFLSLNSQEHHRVIFEVFTEIWETLFTDWL